MGSKNPVKINAAKCIFSIYFPERDIDCQGVNAPSGVPDQPIGEEQTRIGAQNRVNYCKDTTKPTIMWPWKAVQSNLVTVPQPLPM